MKICVVGSGYVGLVTGACLAEFGSQVTCVDRDARKISALRRGAVSIYEPGLVELVRKNLRKGRLAFTTSMAEALKGARVVFIAVGTPATSDGSADLSSVEQVTVQIRRSLQPYVVVVTKSTVPIGTGERLRLILRQRWHEGVEFDVAANPEFLREGSAIQDFIHPDRVVIGVRSPKAVAVLKDLYRPLSRINTPFIVTDVPTAELIKYASNAFLATKVSFINEVANLCDVVGADVHVVAKAMGLDGRIGPRFLRPGPGFGGSCLPKDTRALRLIAKAKGYDFRLLEAVETVNTRQQDRMVGKIRLAAGGLRGKVLGVLGLAFKLNTDDIRDAPSLAIIERLQRSGAAIRAYDPAAMPNAKRVLRRVTYCRNAYEVASGADALILMTEWDQFRNLDLERLKAALRAPVFIDLRNVYDHAAMAAAGLRYTTVGRPSRAGAGS